MSATHRQPETTSAHTAHGTAHGDHAVGFWKVGCVLWGFEVNNGWVLQCACGSEPLPLSFEIAWLFMELTMECDVKA